MIIKAIVVFMMISILFALVRSGLSLVKEQSASNATLISLKWRIGLSIALFIFLFIAFSLGFIQPHSIM